MTIAVDLGRKATKPTNQPTNVEHKPLVEYGPHPDKTHFGVSAKTRLKPAT